MVPWVCLQCVIVVFPDHIHLLFLFIFQMKIKSSLIQFLKKATQFKNVLGPNKKKKSVFRVTGLKFLGRVGTHFFFNYIFFHDRNAFQNVFFQKT